MPFFLTPGPESLERAQERAIASPTTAVEIRIRVSVLLMLLRSATALPCSAIVLATTQNSSHPVKTNRVNLDSCKGYATVIRGRIL